MKNAPNDFIKMTTLDHLSGQSGQNGQNPEFPMVPSDSMDKI